MDAYNRIKEIVGEELVNRMIKQERAANQKHWARKMEAALIVSQRTQEPLIMSKAIEVVIKEMRDDAERYEAQTK